MFYRFHYRFPRCIAGVLIWLSAAMLVAACGGGAGGGSEPQTASLVFDVQWDRADRSSDAYQPHDVADCSDVATVSAAVYGTGGVLLQTGGPWACADGEATISAVPANRDVQIAIVGQLGNGLARYRGDTGPLFFLPAGAPFDAGLIVAGSFLPVPTAPVDGATITSALTLEWNASAGAESYIVEIADDTSFVPASIALTLDAPASSSPTITPDTSALLEDIDYFWRVTAVDGAGNESEGSAARMFIISSGAVDVNDPPVPAIVQPFNGATIPFVDIINGAGLNCSGNATDLEDGTIPGQGLAWSATNLTDGSLLDSVEGTPFTGNAVSFDTFFFTAGGPYRITLRATDSQGVTGTTSHDITVANDAPAAVITLPANGENIDTGLIVNNGGLSCAGTGTDAEDGTLPGVSLVWSATDLVSSVPRVLDSVEGSPITGNAVTLEASFFTPSAYRITLQVTDSAGNTGTTSHDITVTTNTAPRPVITQPVANERFDVFSFSEGGLQCSGSATDLEDEGVPGERLVWTATNLGNGNVFDSINNGPITGEIVFIDGTFFQTPGTYRITLRATDLDGATAETFVDIIVEVPPAA